VPREPEELSGKLLTPAGAELVRSFSPEATQLVLELARKAAQLPLELVAQGVINVSSSHGVPPLLCCSPSLP
jgi:hypothetical protein